MQISSGICKGLFTNLNKEIIKYSNQDFLFLTDGADEMRKNFFLSLAPSFMNMNVLQTRHMHIMAAWQSVKQYMKNEEYAQCKIFKK